MIRDVVRTGFTVAIVTYYHNDVIGLDLPREVLALNRSGAGIKIVKEARHGVR